MTRKTIIFFLLLAGTVALTLTAHSHLAAIILQPPTSAPQLHPVQPLLSLLALLSSLSSATASRVREVLSSPLCANLSSVGKFPSYEPLDFREQGRRLRAYAVIVAAVREIELAQKQSTLADLYTALTLVLSHFERHLFPWSVYLRQSLHTVLSTGTGRGIVMTTGVDHYRYAILNIQHLATLRTHLPVELWLESSTTLPQLALTELRAYNVSVRMMDRYIDTARLHLAGFAFKPFALLLSGFDEALLLDADAYFVQDPIVIFDDPYYQAHGALFFPDARFRPKHSAEKRDFLHHLWAKGDEVPYRVANTAFFKGDSLFEQESSVVVVHRSRRAVGLLGTALLNGWPARDYVYRYVWGDKETFWLGFGLAGEPFDFSPHSPGVIGERRSEGSLCGQMAHPDHLGNLLYWNGGIAPQKSKADIALPIEFAYWGVPSEWMGHGLCLQPKEIKKLTEQEQRVVSSLLDMWRLQQKERDRIAGFQRRVFIAFVALVFLFAMCVCLVLACWGYAAVPQLAERRDDDSDDEEERHQGAMWHRP